LTPERTIGPELSAAPVVLSPPLPFIGIAAESEKEPAAGAVAALLPGVKSLPDVELLEEVVPAALMSAAA
jgi:hypothetical protein